MDAALEDDPLGVAVVAVVEGFAGLLALLGDPGTAGEFSPEAELEESILSSSSSLGVGPCSDSYSLSAASKL